MKYKASQYNIVISNTETKVYVYNSYSGGVCSLEKNIYSQIQKDYSPDKPYFEQLLSEGFIVPQTLNEFGRLLSKQREYLFNDNDKMTIVIAPTSACNLNCIYCFEHEAKSIPISTCTMTQETANQTIKFIESQLEKNNRLSKLSVYWFGGEPLLKVDIIKYISEELIKFCTKNNINYDSYMITNGLLLNKKAATTLFEKCNIQRLQLTIDGDDTFYQLYKNAKSDSLELLINNMKFASTLFKIDVRMNTSIENRESIIQQAKKIMTNKDISENVTVYPAQITDCYNPICHSMSDKEFEMFRRDFENELKPLRAQNGSKPIKVARRLCFCNSMKNSHFVVGPDGNIYKCEHELGRPEQIIGDVNNGFYFNKANSQFYDTPLEEKCMECSFLPFCWGGCPSARIIYKKDVDCDSIKMRIVNKLKNEILQSNLKN